MKMVGEKCENLHGHNWKIEVRVAGKSLDQGGVLVDFGLIKKHVAGVMQQLDHKFLNEVPFFSEQKPPSSENIALYVARELENRLDKIPVTVTRVSAWESEDACATYINSTV